MPETPPRDAVTSKALAEAMAPIERALNSLKDSIDHLDNERPWRTRLLAGAVRIAIILIPALLAYGEYVARSHDARRAQGETQLRLAADQIASESPALQATGLQTLVAVAFERHPPISASGVFAPLENLRRWYRNEIGYPFLERARTLLREFASQPRRQSETSTVVSSALARTVEQWTETEVSLLEKEWSDPSLWLLKEASLVGARVPGLALAGYHMPAVDFRNAYLNSANFSESYMPRARFDKAQLDAAVFSAAILDDCSFESAVLTFARLRGTHAHRADFSKANFSQADLAGADLGRSTFAQSNFKHANLTNTNFYRSNLEGARFDHANLRDADLTEAILVGADLRFALGLEHARSLQGALLEGALLPARFGETRPE